jgi:hypothetical protein
MKGIAAVVCIVVGGLGLSVGLFALVMWVVAATAPFWYGLEQWVHSTSIFAQFLAIFGLLFGGFALFVLGIALAPEKDATRD